MNVYKSCFTFPICTVSWLNCQINGFDRGWKKGSFRLFCYCSIFEQTRGKSQMVKCFFLLCSSVLGFEQFCLILMNSCDLNWNSSLHHNKMQSKWIFKVWFFCHSSQMPISCERVLSDKTFNWRYFLSNFLPTSY